MIVGVEAGAGERVGDWETDLTVSTKSREVGSDLASVLSYQFF